MGLVCRIYTSIQDGTKPSITFFGSCIIVLACIQLLPNQVCPQPCFSFLFVPMCRTLHLSVKYLIGMGTIIKPVKIFESWLCLPGVFFKS